MFDKLSEKITDSFRYIRGKSEITETNIEETMKEIRTALLEADVSFKVVKEFVHNVKEKAVGSKVTRGVDPGQQFVKIMHDELAKLMGQAEGTSSELNEKCGLDFNQKYLLPILVVGLNGAGKTTFCGKLAFYAKTKEKKKVYVIPADNFRPAAKDQLLTLCRSLDVEYFDSNLSETPEVIVAKGLEEAKRLGKEVVIIDTAGRLHVDEELMGVLKNVKTTVSKLYTHHEVVLVADAMTGQESVNVAKVFHESIGLTGAVLSKMDGDARGGAAISIRYVTGVPLYFMSTGEKMKDLEIFHPDRMAKRILDMGDVLSLVEKAQDVIDEKETERMMKNLEKNRFTIDDFARQMEMMGKLGSMESILKMIPGMGGMLRQLGDLSPAEKEMKKMKVIISSMTIAEKENHKIFNESRKQRVAKGSGTSVGDVSQFLQKFDQMQKMMSGMMGMMKGGMPKMPGGGMPGMMGGMGGDPFAGMGGMPPMKGFRQRPGQSDKQKRKGKAKRGPFGGLF